jgi:hypothetical protein
MPDTRTATGYVDVQNCGYSCETISSSPYESGDTLSEVLAGLDPGTKVRITVEVLDG